MKELVFAVVALVGLGFSLSGAVGVLRMPDVYTRIQCSSKTVTMGALPVLAALLIGEGPFGQYGSRVLLIAVLLGVLNPAAAHALARAAYRTGVPMWRGAVQDESLPQRNGERDGERGGSGKPDERQG
ncbi:monovalent cation/H(+) antiporter subunit G [Actinomadura rupiterrae]|uniref:monovalent cation/H(+) antiporter subunit G n=1 Tax=Actinomadura rupiterrae TaxID=559627 RepID=UPI0020A36831|nr:monovalent cation/H(+) antiporter subunit G [Actinomadura rupiterrae]MCP2336309.1 multicomponent Na+:H+ antiporter subunit G [Actinomadura rupiterrae]